MNTNKVPTEEPIITPEFLDEQIRLRAAIAEKNYQDRIQSGDLTRGEKLVGIDFNPSASPAVARAKRLCAELADLLIDRMDHDSKAGPMKKFIYEGAMNALLVAQMSMVKLFTFKY